MYCKNCGEPLNDVQEFCLKCGVGVGNGKKFCANCGKELAEEAIVCVGCGTSVGRENMPVNVEGIKPRSLVTAIILSILTCGIYGIYWFICLTNEMNKAAGRVNDISGGMAFLLTLVTCGIYGYFWAYRMGEKHDAITKKDASSPVLYLILSLIGFNIVVYALLQDALNKAVEGKVILKRESVFGVQ